MMKKLKDNENESSSKMSDLTSQIDKLLANIGTLHGEQDEEQGIKENSSNKKIEEAKEHHLDEDALDTT